MVVGLVDTQNMVYYNEEWPYDEAFQISVYILIAKLYGNDGYPSSLE